MYECGPLNCCDEAAATAFQFKVLVLSVPVFTGTTNEKKILHIGPIVGKTIGGLGYVIGPGVYPDLFKKFLVKAFFYTSLPGLRGAIGSPVTRGSLLIVMKKIDRYYWVKIYNRLGQQLDIFMVQEPNIQKARQVAQKVKNNYPNPSTLRVEISPL